MHALFSIDSLSQVRPSFWWGLRPNDLENIAKTLFGSLPGGWVRSGHNFIRVGGCKYGSDARRLDDELVELAREARHILAKGVKEDAIRAAAFYHLRFENIHPLCEANGRVGRVIMACQLNQSLRIPVAETLVGLKDWENDYSRLFATNQPPIMFELMVDLLARILGAELSPEASRLPGSLHPLHPQKKIPKNMPRLHPEKARQAPTLVKDFARQYRAARGNPFDRFR